MLKEAESPRGASPALWPARWPRTLVAAALALALLTGCAYFNTFYHAKRFYNQAERSRIQEKRTTGRGTPASASNLYKQAIDKCERVIEHYPGSKWQDDAFLLMARAYYGKEDYMGAEQTLATFIERFPQSPLLSDALFLQGLNQFAQDEFEEARTTWTGLLKRYPNFDRREEIEFYVAKAEWKNKQIDRAVEAYGRFLARYPKGEQSTEARLNLGRIYLESKRPQEAETIFKQVASKGKEEEDRIEARLLLGQALEVQGRYKDALAHYTELEIQLDPEVFKGRLSAKEREALRNAELSSRKAAVDDSLRLSQLQGKQNPTESELAGLTDEQLADRLENMTPEEQHLLSEQERLRLEGNLAQASLSQASNPASTASRRNAFDRRRDLNNARDIKLAQVMLREGLMMAKLERPWDAILVFEQVRSEYAQTPYAAEAQYRIGYTQEVLLQDMDAAQQAYAQVGQQGNSSFRDDAVRRVKNLNTVRELMASAVKDTVSLAQKASAEARFMRAELHLFQEENAQKAAEEYRAIETEFPGTEYAAKAGLALAWITETALEDSAGGVAKYTEVAETYPDTEYGRRARSMVFGPEPEPRPIDFAGPTIEELTVAENIEAVRNTEGLEAALAVSAPDTVRAAPPAPTEMGRPSEETLADAPGVAPPVTPTVPGAGGTLEEAMAATRRAADTAPPDPGNPRGDSEVATASRPGPGVGDGPATPPMAEPVAPVEGDPSTPDSGLGAVPPPAVMPDASGGSGAVPEMDAPRTEAVGSPAKRLVESRVETPSPSGPGSPAPRPIPSTSRSVSLPPGLYLDPLAVPEGGPSPVEDGAEEADQPQTRRRPAEDSGPPTAGPGMDRREQQEARRRAAEQARHQKAKADTTSAKDKH